MCVCVYNTYMFYTSYIYVHVSVHIICIYIYIYIFKYIDIHDIYI